MFKDGFVLSILGLMVFVVLVGNLGLYVLVLCKDNKDYFDSYNLKTLFRTITFSLVCVIALVIALVTLAALA